MDYGSYRPLVIRRPINSRGNDDISNGCRNQYVLFALFIVSILTTLLAFSGFDGKFKGSSKEPDFFLRADTSEFPSIVVETGWAESVPHLRADKDIWLKGSKYTEIVLLLKWMEILGGRVKGNIEVWSRTENGDSIVRNLVSTFPLNSV